MYQKYLCNVNRISYVKFKCDKGVAQADQLSQGNPHAVMLPEVKPSNLFGCHFSKQERKDILFSQTLIFAQL